MLAQDHGTRLRGSLPNGVWAFIKHTTTSLVWGGLRRRPDFGNLTWRSCSLDFGGTIEALVHKTGRSAEALAGGRSPSSKAARLSS